MMLPPGLPLKQWVTMSPGQQLEHIVIERRRLADMHHHRQLRDPRDLLRHRTGVMPQAPMMTWLARTLMPDDDVAVGLDAGEGAVEVDRAHVDQLADPVAGDKADRADVEEGEDALLRRLDDELAKAVEIGLAGRAGVDQRGDAARGAALFAGGARCRCRRARHGRADRSSPATGTRPWHRRR